VAPDDDVPAIRALAEEARSQVVVLQAALDREQDERRGLMGQLGAAQAEIAKRTGDLGNVYERLGALGDKVRIPAKGEGKRECSHM
jgi:hypothetical protein